MAFSHSSCASLCVSKLAGDNAVTVIFQELESRKQNKDEMFAGYTLCLGSPVYAVRTVIGRVRSTTLNLWFTLRH